MFIIDYIWEATKKDPLFKASLIQELKTLDTDTWHEDEWHYVNTAFGNGIDIELDVQRTNGVFWIWPVFVGNILTHLDEFKLDIALVEENYLPANQGEELKCL
jgi:hypothetical protein